MPRPTKFFVALVLGCGIVISFLLGLWGWFTTLEDIAERRFPVWVPWVLAYAVVAGAFGTVAFRYWRLASTRQWKDEILVLKQNCESCRNSHLRIQGIPLQPLSPLAPVLVERARALFSRMGRPELGEDLPLPEHWKALTTAELYGGPQYEPYNVLVRLEERLDILAEECLREK